MFGVFQGDRIIVATFYNLSDLATYVAAGQLVLVPGMIFASVLNSVGLPIMSKTKLEFNSFRKRYRQMTELVVLFSTTSTVCMILSSEFFMVLVYGNKYVGGGIVLTWFAVQYALTILRMAPTIGALAQGDSQNSLFSNIGRVVGLVPALAAALAKAPIWGVAASGLVGEAVACWIAFKRLEKRDKIPISEILGMVIVLAIVVGASCFVWWSVVQRINFLFTVLVTILGTILGGALVILRSKELRNGTINLWMAFSNEGWNGLWRNFKASAIPK